MRRRAFAAAAAAAVVVSLGGFASAASADTHVSNEPVGSANLHATDVPKVPNTWGPGGEVHYDVEPVNHALGEFTSASNIEWISWGPEEAVGIGDFTGRWFEGTKEDVTITFSEVEDGLYTKWSVSGTGDPEQLDRTYGFFY